MREFMRKDSDIFTAIQWYVFQSALLVIFVVTLVLCYLASVIKYVDPFKVQRATTAGGFEDQAVRRKASYDRHAFIRED